jgi:nicotinate-nucleotide pyrophosphorylase (carboxylating)
MHSDPKRLPDPNQMSLPEFARHLRGGGLVERLINLARDEDLGTPPRDWTGELMFTPDQTSEVVLRARDAGVVSGLAFMEDLVAVFAPMGEVAAELMIEDGAMIQPGTELAILRGHARSIVALERTMLNLISRMSGIATRTHRFVGLVEGTGAMVCDTRKTTPGLRAFEKYAVRCGGGTTHRLGLYDAVLIKDNHVSGLSPQEIATALRGIAYTIEQEGARLQFVQVEVDTLDQLERVLGVCSGIVEIILLDNMVPSELVQAVEMRDRLGVEVLLEASGGVSAETIAEIARSGVDRISVGGLTHQAQSLDLGLDTI